MGDLSGLHTTWQVSNRHDMFKQRRQLWKRVFAQAAM